jgi:hypothetical protein
LSLFELFHITCDHLIEAKERQEGENQKKEKRKKKTKNIRHHNRISTAAVADHEVLSVPCPGFRDPGGI